MTLAIEDPRAASYRKGEMVKQAARAREPTIVAHPDGKNRCVCMTRAPDDPASCIGVMYAYENSDELLKVFSVS